MDDKSAMNAPARPLDRIVLGVTGGIAAYKAAELVRLLVKEGIAVDVVMTAVATKFIAPMTLQALSGNPVLSDLWDSGAANAMGHIELSRHADAILVAPASADFMARLAHGLADDLLSTLCLARDCPLLVAPAMNRQMWTHLATQRNVARLQADGVVILGPGRGDVTSASEMAAMVEASVAGCDVFIAVAAVADYTPGETHATKLKKTDAPLTVTLKPTVDILAAVAARQNPPYCIGFAAETNNVNENAEAKRRRKKVPLVIANRAQDAFGKDQNEVTLLDDNGAHPLPRMDKLALARRLVAEFGQRLPSGRTT